MTNDHLQRQIEFIVNNQAQFTTDIQQLKELHKEAEKRIAKLEDVCVRLGNALVNFADKTTATQTNLDAKMAALAESQAYRPASQRADRHRHGREKRQTIGLVYFSRLSQTGSGFVSFRVISWIVPALDLRSTKPHE